MHKVTSIQTRLIELEKVQNPLVLADTFPKVQSGESQPVLDLCNTQDADKIHDPCIQGLVDRLPEPDSIWSLDDRVRWLRTAANIFALIYKCREGEDKEVKLVLAKD
jgi:hypothetical protein